MARSKQWSYSVGERKTATAPSSVVRVYERPDVDGLFMSMAWDTLPSGRPKESRLPAWMGRAEAKALAAKLSAERRLEVLTGQVAERRTGPVTLRELWRRYLASADADAWSPKHRGDLLRARDFWLLELRPDTPIPALTRADVEKIARDARIRTGYSPRWERRRLAGLRSAIRWGHLKARLYDQNPILGLSMPDYSPDTDDLLYSAEETRLLCTPREEIDWRVTLVVNITIDTGRRLTSILRLRVDDVLLEGDRVALRFRAEHDKRRRAAVRPVSLETTGLLLTVLDQPAVTSSGWMVPAGRLKYADERERPWSKTGAIRALHRTERLLGIKVVRGRAYHGLKRRHVTTAMEVSHGDASLVGDQTGNVSRELIEQTYRKVSRTRLTGHVESVRSAIWGPNTPENHP